MLNDGEDSDDDLFFQRSPRKEIISMRRCHEQVEVDVHGAGNMVMALV